MSEEPIRRSSEVEFRRQSGSAIRGKPPTNAKPGLKISVEMRSEKIVRVISAKRDSTEVSGESCWVVGDMRPGRMDIQKALLDVTALKDGGTASGREE